MNKQTIPYFLIAAGLIVSGALIVLTLPTVITEVYALPQDVQMTIGLFSILGLTMFAMVIVALNSRIR